MYLEASPPASLPLTTSRSDLLEDGTDHRFRQLVHDLLAFSSRLQEVRDQLAQIIGLSGPRYTILISVAHLATRREVRVTSVARHLNYSQPFVTTEVNKLVRDGLVDKAASDLDGRSVSLTITDRGLRLLGDLAPSQRDINDQLFEAVSGKTFALLSDLVPRLVADADRALELAAASPAATPSNPGIAG